MSRFAIARVTRDHSVVVQRMNVASPLIDTVAVRHS
jgi:hypothetical protein